MDNARYQRNAKVTERAEALGIELLYLPPYSPNLSLIERVMINGKGGLGQTRARELWKRGVVAPIDRDNIKVRRGAAQSGFHIFEKASVQQWEAIREPRSVEPPLKSRNLARMARRSGLVASFPQRSIVVHGYGER